MAIKKYLVTGIDINLNGKHYQDGDEIRVDIEKSPKLAKWLQEAPADKKIPLEPDQKKPPESADGGAGGKDDPPPPAPPAQDSGEIKTDTGSEKEGDE